MEFVSYEEFRQHDAENQDEDENFARVIVEGWRIGQIRKVDRTAIEKDNQPGKRNHHQRVKVSEPGDNDRGEAIATRGICCHFVVDSGNIDETDKAAKSAGKNHREDDAAGDFDARVASRVQTLADHLKFVTAFGVAEEDPHREGQDSDDDKREINVGS